MTENKRFKIKLSHIGELMECETKTILATADIAEELIPLCDLLNELHEENEQLKAQLLYDGDSVCNICKHQYLVENGKYYVAKCEKEHEECSKVDLQYCEDFELVRDYK